MTHPTVVGLDLAKQVFQVHGQGPSGEALFNRTLRRQDVEKFFEKLAPTVVAMEACGSAHHWARRIAGLGHQVRIIPAQYVKQMVNRGKTDAQDAAAICRAAARTDIRFVPVKTTDQQGAAMTLRTRTLLVRLRGNAVNALRGHMAELGLVAESGIAQIDKLAKALPTEDDTSFPRAARFAIAELFAEIEALTYRIKRLDIEIAAQAKTDDDIQRLNSIPGIATLTAATIKAYVPDPGTFKSARHFAASLGLTPKANSSGGKHRVGRISKMGNPVLRSLLYVGATTVINGARRSGKGSNWLKRLLERRPYKVVAIALANKTARIVWALLMNGSRYKQPAPVSSI